MDAQTAAPGKSSMSNPRSLQLRLGRLDLLCPAFGPLRLQRAWRGRKVFLVGRGGCGKELLQGLGANVNPPAASDMRQPDSLAVPGQNAAPAPAPKARS